MTLSQAVAARLNELIAEKQITQYRLTKNATLAQTTIGDIRHMRNKSMELYSVYCIAQLGMTLCEFFDSPLFSLESIDD